MQAPSVVTMSNGPSSVGIYSQAVVLGEFLFRGWQLLPDPVTGKLERGNAAAQTGRWLANLNAICHVAATQLSNALGMRVYLIGLSQLAAVNPAYAESFGAEPAARTTIGVPARLMNASAGIRAIVAVPI
jgi:2-iminobutanoate/2-iminopropanoate deaminase